jgi:hypothetical protein
VTFGKAARWKGGGVLLGDEERPLPSMFGTTMKYRCGSSARPAPIIASVSVCCAP